MNLLRLLSLHVFTSSTTGNNFYHIVAFGGTTARFSDNGLSFYVTFFFTLSFFTLKQYGACMAAIEKQTISNLMPFRG